MKCSKVLAVVTSFLMGAGVSGAMSDQEIVNADIKELVHKMTPLEGTTPAQWRVVWTGDTMTTATISWSTAAEGSKHTVHYGTQSHGKSLQKYSHRVQSSNNGEYTQSDKEKADGTKKAYYHHCTLTGLKPQTRYYFVIESDGATSRELHFYTCPKKEPFTVIHGGDSRSGHSSRCKMNLRIAKELEDNPRIVALAHGGDYVYAGNSYRQWRLWMSHHELTTTEKGRVIPIIPTRGNHDGGELFFEVFNLKKTGEKNAYWQTTHLGENITLVTLDTNVPAEGPQEAWLDSQLKEHRKKANWLLTQYHRPLFPAVKSPARQAKTFVPLFEKYNVDLACESDGHCIKRTVPIRDGKKDPTGVTYIGEGGLGVGQYRPKPDRWFLQGGTVSRGHHIMLLDFTAKTLGIRTVLMDGSEFDSHSLKVRR